MFMRPLFRPYSLRTRPYSSRTRPEILRQRVWFDENRKELLEKYRGKWIALHKCKVVAVAEDDIALCKEIDHKGSDHFIYEQSTNFTNSVGIKKSEVLISPVFEGPIPDGASLVLPIDA